MIKIRQSIIKILIFSIFSSGGIAEELFYKNPTKESLDISIKDFDKNLNQNSDLPIIRFLTIIFKTYPYLSNEVCLEKYSNQMQKHLAQSLINNDLKKSLLTKFNLSKSSNMNLDAEYDHSVGSYPKMNENMYLTDLFWTAYFVTGEEKYLKKILKFIASHSITQRTLVYELFNRDMLHKFREMTRLEDSSSDYQDIIGALTESERYDLLSCKIAIWSMNSNREKYTEINDKVKDLIAQDSSLDYTKDIEL